MATGNCTLTTESPVLRLEAAGKGRVTAAIYADAKGQEHSVNAELFAVACGAVETPRLLLNSACAAAPHGVANETGLVGRNFMETLYWVSAGLHPERLGSNRGLPSDAICWDYNAPDAIPDIIGGCRFTPATLESDLAGPISYSQRVVGGWGVKHKQAMREQFGRVLAVNGIGESLPNAGSYIDLDAEVKDSFGMPRARINSYLDNMELKRLRFIAGKSRSILNAAGASHLIEEFGSYDMFNSTHVFGTCRMGLDPESSVVDAHCRSHHWSNLMIVDASVFPSSGGGESPSLTISAIALRAAKFALAEPG
jgi:choline dehydrogenase-like flavoprotein